MERSRTPRSPNPPIQVFRQQMEQLENGHWRSWARMTSWAAGAERLPEPATWVFEGNTEGKERIPETFRLTLRLPFLQVRNNDCG